MNTSSWKWSHPSLQFWGIQSSTSNVLELSNLKHSFCFVHSDPIPLIFHVLAWIQKGISRLVNTNSPFDSEILTWKNTICLRRWALLRTAEIQFSLYYCCAQQFSANMRWILHCIYPHCGLAVMLSYVLSEISCWWSPVQSVQEHSSKPNLSFWQESTPCRACWTIIRGNVVMKLRYLTILVRWGGWEGQKIVFFLPKLTVVAIHSSWGEESPPTCL